VLLLTTLVVGSGCASLGSGGAAPTASLRAAIDSIIDAPPLHRAHWGIHITDAQTGAVLYSRNADRHFIPASSLKLVTAAAALAHLGEDYRWRTPLLLEGRAGENVRTLIAVGSGDPTWSARFHGDAAAPIDSMAALVARSGVRTIGALVIDASRFSDVPVVGAWEVGDLPWQYAPPTDAFAMAEGTFRIVVTGGAAAGAPATVRVIGSTPQPVRITATTDTAGAPATLRIDYLARRDTVFGAATVGAAAADTSTLAVTRPAESAAAALADALRRRDVAVGAVRVLRDSAQARALLAGATRIGELVSPPLREVVPAFMRPSQNWITEQLLKTLAAERAGNGSWAGGLDASRTFMYDVVGVDSGSLNLRDASGLSAQNLLTPLATVRLLDHARAQPWGATFRDALPMPGQAGTTLSSRLETLAGRVHAKTGTISNVAALTGYIVARDGRELGFAIMVNGSGVSSATTRQAIDDVVLAIGRYLDGR
jgi:serine-type D-Ala-D-Ala carboxypeptidase/endopeptidase (penicillin-binding protein 4)